ncbi:S9 family peptidase [Flavobacterium sp. xlx-214]|uniref:alpha/beta hydrolase family protein n=1 Tax=unclassified Flavobacterium TaxID=196869 RepID=UPI0013CFB58A|nr:MULTISPECIES: prolyl oligopeptidase family serine peptidase [unclassified Flavobacterium]MBA5791562.1 S9 family peptidase [Flavobacterium sp. xlx-221]QMI82811.1 S9 family peptidase [Flavobacterium sp. xlx-214]
MKHSLLNIILIFSSLTCSMFAQVKDSQNERLVNDLISENGTILSYYSIYKNEPLRYTLVDTKADVKYTLLNVVNVHLTNDLFIGQNNKRKEIYIVNFEKKAIDTLCNVEKYMFLSNKKNTLIVSTTLKNVQITNALNRTDLVKYENVSDFYFSDDLQLLLLKCKKNDILVDFNYPIPKETVVPLRNLFNFKKVIGNNNNEVYLLGNSKDSICILKKEINNFKTVYKSPLLLNKGNAIDTLFTAVNLLKSNIILGTIPKTKNQDVNSNVEIWRGSERGITKNIEKQYLKQKPLVLIDINNQKLINFYDDQKLLDFKVNYQDELIYEYEINEHNDYTKQFSDITVYSRSRLNNWERQLLRTFNGAPSGVFNFISKPQLFYFHNKNWYYIDNEIEKKITYLDSVVFYKKEYVHLNTDAFLKRPVLYNENYLLLKAIDDVYLYNLKTQKLKKLTINSKKNRNYDFISSSIKFINEPWLFATDWTIENKRIILKWNDHNYKREGISIFDQNFEQTDLLEINGKISQVKSSKDIITYITESYDKPPAIFKMNLKSKKITKLYQSNSWDDNVNVHSEQLDWISNHGNLRKLTIRYPKELIAGKKYPVILSIYEKKIHEFNQYQSPSQIMSSNINYRNYVDDGYIVIEPDIYYDDSGPGISAVKCIEDVIEKMKSIDAVDMDNIGLIGHSFGGYETNFIITQTNKFKVAVSSAGVADLKAYYFTVNWNTLEPDMWRMETQQWRMGGSIYNLQDKYQNNSPINFAENVSTPLLLLAGTADYKINWNQSVMFYVALQKLKKDVTLLLYQNEDHEILNEDKKLDASKKIKDWFDYFLKNREKPDWM